MKKKILWLGLSLLLVASVILSSCGTAVTSTTTTTAATTTTTTQTTTQTTTATSSTTTTTAAPLGPQYGGSLVAAGYRTNGAPGGWDVCNVPFASDAYFYPYLEFLLTGDIAGKGPRGSNEFSFQIQEGIPLGFLTGQLAESWEHADLLTLVFHLRKGIMWTGNASLGIAPREFVADDVAYSLDRYWKSSYGGGNTAYFDSVTATGKYTVTIKMNKYSPEWPYRTAYAFKCEIQPSEVVKAGAQNWKNQTGTGPFILTDYVDGSEATYTKNPNYWGTATISGKSYQLPFIDKLKYPIIPDLSTEIAAIRTGKIDIAWQVPATYKPSLISTSPDLKTYDFYNNSVLCVGFNTANAIFKNVNVRRALMIGTDLQTISKSVYPGGAELNSFPLAKGLPAWTAIQDMPASTKELFTYDAVKAKQMLADAGYSAGFKCELIIQSANPTYNDIASLLVSQWSKLGVTVTLKPLDTPAWSGIMVGHQYPDLFMSSTGNGATSTHLQIKAQPGVANTANWSDPKATALLERALQTSDDALQTAIFKELNLYELDQCAWIGFPSASIFGAYWPWVKNFYNEVEGADYNYVPMIKLIWMDQGLKKKMGY